MSLQEQLRFNSIGLLRSALVILDDHLRDIQTAKEIKQELSISNPFPLLDFQVDQQQNLVFTPVTHTIILDFFAFAASQGRTDILKALLALPGPVKTCDPAIMSPLCLSLLNRRIDTAKFLLSKGADPRGLSCTNGLHAAARAGCPEMVLDFLVNWNIPADCTDAYGATPVMYALYLPEQEAIGIIDILIRHGAYRKMTFGDNTKTYAYYASAMKKYGLSSWLQDMERVHSNTMEYIQKHTKQLQLDDATAKKPQRLHSEEQEAGWVDVGWA
ncbi:uncharacterized protein FRV6_11814 [Fusarium oxysporum]|uniref:Uncharacterized protein n=1 Tax=Fusarium oxysporum TaxID=5507 RepID=A0A2H3TGF1_FUSOX|nr:uncharacterized protein FRV6_11814 [Fusarium oxysporum]